MCEKPPERKTHLSKTHSNIPRKHVLNPIHKRFATAHGDVAKCRHCHYFPASQTASIKKEGGVKDLFDKCPPIMFSEENGFLRACEDKATLRPTDHEWAICNEDEGNCGIHNDFNRA